MCEVHRTIKPEKTLAYCSPELSSEWDMDKNFPLTPSNVYKNSTKKVWWTCSQRHSWLSTPNNRYVNKNNCPYCSGRLASPENNLAVNSPHLLQFWDETRNGDVKPTELLPQSHKVVWWTCEKGHSYDMSVTQRQRSKSCPYCDGKRIGEDNNLAILRPEILPFWDKQKNDISPFTIAPNSNKYTVHWKCIKGHSWTSTPAGFGNCPYCLNRKIDKDNSLQSMHPELSKEWHPTKNKPLTPKSIVPGTLKKVWWECGKCHHEWKAPVRNRANRGTGCPECSKGTGTSFAEQSLFYYLQQIFPKAVNRYLFEVEGKKLELDIYLPEVNIGIEYDGYYYHHAPVKIKKDRLKNKLLRNKLQLLRIREKGLSGLSDFNAISYIRKSHEKNELKDAVSFIIDFLLTVPTLSKEAHQNLKSLEIDIAKDTPAIYELMNLQEQEQSIGNKHPHILPYWDNDKNGNLSPFYFRDGNETEVHWKCENNHTWQEPIRRIVSRKQICPTCHSFAYNYPTLLQKWDFDYNQKYDPYTLLSGSRAKVWWKCEEGHSYQRTIFSEVNSHTCPYCTNQLINHDNCLSTTHPLLAEQWHPTKNGTLTPSQVTFGSGQSVWWKCDKEHEWECNIANRRRDGKIRNCPYCVGQKAGYGNTLSDAVQNGTVEPSALDKWDYEKNSITPDDVVPGSTKKVWWKCENEHSWEAPVFNQSSGGNQCATCQSVGFLFPELMENWNWTLNEGLDPYVLAPTSVKKVYWTCENGHPQHGAIKSMVSNKQTCSDCQMIGFVQPEFYKEWDDDKNKGVFDPLTISMGNSRRRVNWKCTHGHEWTATIYSRNKENNTCPTCQSLGFLNPELAGELHPTKNGDLNPFLVTVSSGKKVWWQCDKGHEWQASISHRNGGTGCNKCPKGKVTDSNRFSTMFPLLAQDWNYEKNEGYTPEEFSGYSGRMVDWKCSICAHEWRAKIVSRAKGCHKCSHCKQKEQ